MCLEEQKVSYTLFVKKQIHARVAGSFPSGCSLVPEFHVGGDSLAGLTVLPGAPEATECMEMSQCPPVLYLRGHQGGTKAGGIICCWFHKFPVGAAYYCLLSL